MCLKHYHQHNKSLKIVNEELTELMGGEQAPFRFEAKPNGSDDGRSTRGR